MSSKRHKPEEIVAKLRQVDVLTSQGSSVADTIRQIGVTEVTYGTSCWMARSSIRSARPRSSSKAGAGITMRCGRMPRWATAHRPRRCSFPRLRRGRRRQLDQLRRPRSR